LEELVRQSDLIITGEGKMDEQTLSGKVIHGVAELSRKYGRPLVVLVGKNELSDEKTSFLGVRKVVALMDGKTQESEAFRHTYSLIKKRVKDEIIPFFL
jgi:glycerate kinase